MEESILMTMHYGQIESGLLELIRDTEAEDVRITEAGDTRITDGAITNIIQGILIATPTLIPWNSQTYYNRSGVWKNLTIYVKHNGTWKQPLAIYKNISGNWKRGQ